MAQLTDITNPFYDGYEAWQGWQVFFSYNASEARYYAGEMRGILLAGQSVLEIGFGAGAFLAWAREQGAEVAGTEINSAALDQAVRFGVDLLDPAIESLAADHRERFDVIVAFDVFEHFTLGEVANRLGAVEIMLRPGGTFVLRFPNGQSPFGLLPQHGDITHQTALSRDKIEQISRALPLRTERYSAAFRERGPLGLRRLVRGLRYLARDALGAGLNLIFATDIPWDPVVVLVMRKRSQ